VVDLLSSDEEEEDDTIMVKHVRRSSPSPSRL